MTAHAKDILRDALTLTAEERAELAEELFVSIGGEAEAEIQATWGTEIERRARRALADDSGSVPWETVRARSMEKLGKR